MKHILFILAVGLFSCDRGKPADISAKKKINAHGHLVMLYHQCDTVIRTPGILKVVNSKLDTTIIETGIFTFLQYDYPLTTPHKLVVLSKAAVRLDKAGQKEKAGEFYKDMIDFYLEERPEQLKGLSDMNGYLQYEVNSAILCSYAYERLGKKDNAIRTLLPFLANAEARNSGIHERYIQLCIDEYGTDKVRAELNNCGRTIKLKKQDSPEKDDWVVSVFGADIGVGKAWERDHISASRADSLIRQTGFYKSAQ